MGLAHALLSRVPKNTHWYFITHDTIFLLVSTSCLLLSPYFQMLVCNTSLKDTLIYQRSLVPPLMKKWRSLRKSNPISCGQTVFKCSFIRGFSHLQKFRFLKCVSANALYLKRRCYLAPSSNIVYSSQYQNLGPLVLGRGFDVGINSAGLDWADNAVMDLSLC